MFVSGVGSGGRVVTAQLDSRDGSAGRWHPARLAGRTARRAGCHLPAEPSLESSCAVTTRPPEPTPDTNIRVTTKVTVRMPSRSFACNLFQNDPSAQSHSETTEFRILDYWFTWIDPPHAVMRFRPATQRVPVQIAVMPPIHRRGV